MCRKPQTGKVVMATKVRARTVEVDVQNDNTCNSTAVAVRDEENRRGTSVVLFPQNFIRPIPCKIALIKFDLEMGHNYVNEWK